MSENHQSNISEIKHIDSNTKNSISLKMQFKKNTDN